MHQNYVNRVACQTLIRAGLIRRLPGAGPDDELGAHFNDVLLREPVPGELLIGQMIELPARINEVFCGQAWIETASEADQLLWAVVSSIRAVSA
jgi:hypothetical protein